MKTVLLLSAGTNACYHVSKTLKTLFPNDFKIIGADINALHLIPTAPYLDTFFQVPYSTDPKYYNTILQICRNEHVDFLIPSFDSDQQMFYPENPDLLACGTISLGTPKATLPIYQDKATMNAFLFKNGFIVPREFTATQCDANTKYMVKPINGVGSIGAGLKTGAEIAKIDTSHHLIQEQLNEPEITMECFYHNGRLSVVCRERIAAKSGVCVKGRVFNDEKLKSVAKNFVQILSVPHIFNLQFMQRANGEYAITDVNLRTAGGMSMAAAAGWDEVSALARVMLRRPTEEVFSTLPDNIPETFIMRAYTDIITKKER